eukprot:3468729-Prymnesium_polylepis.1
MVKATLQGKHCNDNSVIAFHDNSSSIKGYPVRALRPSAIGAASAFEVRQTLCRPKPAPRPALLNSVAVPDVFADPGPALLLLSLSYQTLFPTQALRASRHSSPAASALSRPSPTSLSTAGPRLPRPNASQAVDDEYHLILTAETHNFPCG